MFMQLQSAEGQCARNFHTLKSDDHNNSKRQFV